MSRRRMFGFAAAACVACCAGPFLAAVGGIAALGAIGTVAFGIAALAVAGVAIAALVVVRRRRARRGPAMTYTQAQVSVEEASRNGRTSGLDLQTPNAEPATTASFTSAITTDPTAHSAGPPRWPPSGDCSGTTSPAERA